jgi:hypothetical protein
MMREISTDLGDKSEDSRTKDAYLRPGVRRARLAVDSVPAR